MGLYFMLFAGASAIDSPADGGALAFSVNSSPMGANWTVGSAFMLVAGAGISDPSASGGAFSFYVYPSPSATHWAIGSALFLLSIFICIFYE